MKDVPLIQYVEWLKNKEYFSILKWGDAEWKALFAWRKFFAGQEFSLEFRKDLEQSLMKSAKFKHPRTRILFSIPSHIRTKEGIAYRDRYLQQQNLTEIFWVETNTFYNASRDGKLFLLIQELRRKTVVVIGPAFLRNLSKQTFQYADFVEVPFENAYAEKNEILKSIRQISRRLGNNLVYSFSTGPSAETFIAPLLPEMLENFLIDFGSLWDNYCGRKTRKYMWKKCSPKIMRQNLGL